MPQDSGNAPINLMTTILDTLQKGTGYLERHGVTESRLNMQYLLAHVLDCKRMQLYLDFDQAMDEASLERLRDLVKRRGEGRPLQHLLGTVEFCGFEFKCDGRGLVPRPETEQLVELIMAKEWPQNMRILDMGTGSGVIGLTLAGKLGEELAAKVTLADLSAEALSLAEENRGLLGIGEDRVCLLQSDLFVGVSGRFDLIVANLPYLPGSDMQTLSREVQYDPKLALEGGQQGTEIMERFLNECREYLNPGGKVTMEFGFQQAKELKKMAESAGFGEVEIVSDDSGHERFLFAGDLGADGN